jgi:hypothetical protein
MIKIFLLYLSAQTPANNEITNCGKNEHMVDIVTMIPELVDLAIYQIIANCTKAEPNKDMVWLDKNKIVCAFQFECFLLFILLSSITYRGFSFYYSKTIV